jgi:hypothetical protein
MQVVHYNKERPLRFGRDIALRSKDKTKTEPRGLLENGPFPL